jgi:phosphoadenosine phosphosulfate reductase
MNELKKKEAAAIEALRTFEPEEGYYLCYSGGKDSDVIRILASLAGVKHDIVHNLTTADAPETVQYIKSIDNIIINKARYPDGSHKTMWNLIPFYGLPPTRLMRYCCKELKEPGGVNRLKITGVRAAESMNRRKNSGDIIIIGKPSTTRKFLEKEEIPFSETEKRGLILNFDNSESRRAVEHCYRTTSTIINPILSWSEKDVWQFLNFYNCSANPLYKCGFSRVGCVGCPLGGVTSMRREFDIFPKFKNMYIKTFDRMLKEREKKGKTTKLNWKSGEEVFYWWIESPNLPGQLSFFEE